MIEPHGKLKLLIVLQNCSDDKNKGIQLRMKVRYEMSIMKLIDF